MPLFASIKRLVALLLIAPLALTASLAGAEEAEPRRYAPEWDSLRNYRVPEWYRDAKFGVWTHWGVYSVPAHRGAHAGEWYPRWMHLRKDPGETPFTDYELLGVPTSVHHRKTYGDPAAFGYHDFVPLWKAEKWDPDAWAQLAIDSGARFFTITGMHHDGFALHDSDHTPWNAADRGPRRDLVGDLATAVRARGLRFGISNHFAHNRNYYSYYFKNGYDRAHAKNPELAELYSHGEMDDAYVQRWWDITTELVDKYDPDLYYFDWGWDPPFWKEQWPRFFSHYYNHAIEKGMGEFGAPGVVLNYKHAGVPRGCGVVDLERATMRSVQRDVWQTDTSVSVHSWGYATEDTFKSPTSLIQTLVDITSKNGVLMLNFGPRADGTVPEECSTPLLEMGRWLRVNGEAVYATRPWRVAEEGPTNFTGETALGGPLDVRYTQSKDGKAVYATAFGLTGGPLTLLQTRVSGDPSRGAVTMLAGDRDIPHRVDADGHLVLDLSGVTPETAGCRHAYSFRLTGFELEPSGIAPWELTKAYLAAEPLGGERAVASPVRVSELSPVNVRAHNGVKRGTDYFKRRTARLGGKEYPDGLMVCPAGREAIGFLVVDATGFADSTRLTADIGIEDATKNAGSCRFHIEVRVGDSWRELYRSGVIRGSDKSESIDVAIPDDADLVALITTDGGDGGNSDHALWGDAEFAPAE